MDDTIAVSVSDFLTERCRVQDILYCLASFRCAMNMLANERIDSCKPRIIVTNMSWAILHASVLIFCGCFIQTYLEKTFEALRKGSPIRETIIFVCSSHLIARLAKTRPGFAAAKEKRFFLTCFGKLLMATTLQDAVSIWKQIIVISKSRSCSDSVSAAVHFFTADTSQVEETDVDEAMIGDIDACIDETSLLKASPLMRFFGRHLEVFEEDRGSKPNPHFNPAALEHVLRQWLSIFGLWSAAVLNGTGYHYITNAKIESWFA